MILVSEYEIRPIRHFIEVLNYLASTWLFRKCGINCNIIFQHFKSSLF